MRPIGSMRFSHFKLGFAVLASAFLAAGVSSVAFSAARNGTSGSSCYSTCPSLTRLAIAGHVTHFGSEQNVAFDVRAAQPRARLEFTDGGLRPGSPSNLPSAPATAFAYDQTDGRKEALSGVNLNPRIARPEPLPLLSVAWT